MPRLIGIGQTPAYHVWRVPLQQQFNRFDSVSLPNQKPVPETVLQPSLDISTKDNVDCRIAGHRVSRHRKMATVIRTEKRQRSLFGKLVKWLFVAFNISMLVWLISAIVAVSNLTPDSDAARVGHAIGATLGFYVIVSIWMSGVLILGLFVLLTRGNTMIVEETRLGDAMSGGSVGGGQEPTAGAVDADAIINRYVENSKQVSAQSVTAGNVAQSGFGKRRTSQSPPPPGQKMKATSIVLCVAVALLAGVPLLFMGSGTPVVDKVSRPEVKQAGNDIADNYRVLAAAARCCHNAMRPVLEKYGEKIGDKWKEVTRKEIEEFREMLIFRGIEVPKKGGLAEATFDLTMAIAEMKVTAAMEETGAKLKRSIKQSAEEIDYERRALKSRIDDSMRKTATEAAAESERRKAEFEQSKRDAGFREWRMREEREDAQLRAAAEAQQRHDELLRAMRR